MSTPRSLGVNVAIGFFLAFCKMREKNHKMSNGQCEVRREEGGDGAGEEGEEEGGGRGMGLGRRERRREGNGAGEKWDGGV